MTVYIIISEAEVDFDKEMKIAVTEWFNYPDAKRNIEGPFTIAAVALKRQFKTISVAVILGDIEYD